MYILCMSIIYIRQTINDQRTPPVFNLVFGFILSLLLPFSFFGISEFLFSFTRYILLLLLLLLLLLWILLLSFIIFPPPPPSRPLLPAPLLKKPRSPFLKFENCRSSRPPLWVLRVVVVVLLFKIS